MILATRDRMVPAALQEMIELRIDVAPWTATESAQFIAALKQAGVSHEIFTGEAINAIHDLTNGVPATVVTLCNLSLLATMERGEKLITSEFVEAAVSEMPSRIGDRTRQPASSTVARLSESGAF
jgi:type II secretory pathway predicted ATPase ExeA